jgi:AbrB family looped-hinge helix DNA binding protein
MDVKKIKLSKDGRLVIPASVCAELGLTEGSALILYVKDVVAEFLRERRTEAGHP